MFELRFLNQWNINISRLTFSCSKFSVKPCILYMISSQIRSRLFRKRDPEGVERPRDAHRVRRRGRHRRLEHVEGRQRHQGGQDHRHRCRKEGTEAGRDQR